MKRDDLEKILSEFLAPLGFKRKGNWWARNREEINTLVNLQKSQFGNSFYINYGYVLRTVPLNGTAMHIYLRVGSADKTEMRHITELLDLEKSIPDAVREVGLRRMILKNLVADIEPVRLESDVLAVIERLATLNVVPLVVRKHFRLG